MTPEQQENKAAPRYMFVGICATHGEVIRDISPSLVCRALQHHYKRNLQHGETECKGLDIQVEDLNPPKYTTDA
jgi:hypothetical protein